MQDQGELLYGVSRAELVAICGVDSATASRWKREKTRMPAAARRLVELRIWGEAEALLGADWRGWRFWRDGLLYAPGWRRGWSPGEILTIPYLYGRIAAQERRLRELTAERSAHEVDHHQHDRIDLVERDRGEHGHRPEPVIAFHHSRLR